MTHPSFDLYSRPDYFRDLAARIGRTKKGDRVVVASMIFIVSEPLVMAIVDALQAAVERGVRTHLLIDAHSFLARESSLLPGPLWSHRELPATMPEPYNTWVAILTKFKASGGTYAVLNIPAKPFSNPYAGRSHIKGAIVNDYIYLGGCNLQDPKHIDIMAGRHHAESADWTYDWLITMADTASTPQTYKGVDQYRTFTDGTQIIIDAGVRKQSAIYDRALQLIDGAKERIYLTCQYFPGGATGQHLLAAYTRGVDVRIVYSHPSVHGGRKILHMLHDGRERLRLPSDFFAEEQSPSTPKLHAKVLIADDVALIGSHNYVPQGVSFGTAEIALQNNDPAFCEAVIRKIGSQL